MTRNQYERIADIAQNLGLASIVGSVADAVFSTAPHRLADMIGIMAGLLCLIFAVLLTSKYNGGKV